MKLNEVERLRLQEEKQQLLNTLQEQKENLQNE